MASKSTIIGKVGSPGERGGARLSGCKSAVRTAQAQQQGFAPVTVKQGLAKGGFVVYGSPIQPRHISVDRISQAVLALKAK